MVIIVLSAYLLEEYSLKYRSESHTIIYEKLDLLKPEKKDKLLKDISDTDREGDNKSKDLQDQL